MPYVWKSVNMIAQRTAVYILVISYKNISSASRIGLTILNGDMIFIEDGEIVEKKL